MGRIVARVPLHPVLLQHLNAALAPGPAPRATRRDAALPDIPGKVHAVIGMRRAGKTTFLRQLVADRRATLPPERAVLLGFDDDRLTGLGAADLGDLLEEYFRRFPGLRGRETVHWFLDEVQLVSGWERFVRRVIDTERIECVVSGSSARMLSREVHTSLRGRGVETVIRPFGFREFLRHRGEEPASPPQAWLPAERSRIEARLREYLVCGGFPEVQGLAPALRHQILQGYVETVVFRDVVDRHGVSQVAALRWLVRHCLRNPAGSFSVHRMHADLRAQGLGVAKDLVHALVGHLIDAFLVSAVPVATDSERRRNSNPRKVYPADAGLIGAFDVSGRSNLGHALETVVHAELQSRGADVAYVRNADGSEVDFLARHPGGAPELIQVCADPSSEGVLDREAGGLAVAAKEFRRAERRVIVLDQQSSLRATVPGAEVVAAADWLLGAGAPPR